MNWKPIHEIQIIHQWIEVDIQTSVDGSVTTIKNCRICGSVQRVLDLDRSESHGSNSTDVRPYERLGELKEMLDRISAMFDAMNRDVLDGTDYGDITDLLSDLELRYGRQIRSGDISYDQLRSWIDAPTKKMRRKVLLVYKQGLVCNRCYSLVFSLNGLTEDHIVPRASGGQSTLLNLQLLCGRCNEAKGSIRPKEVDVSPFAYQGPPCIHKITCVAVDELRQAEYRRHRRKVASISGAD